MLKNIARESDERFFQMDVKPDYGEKIYRIKIDILPVYLKHYGLQGCFFKFPSLAIFFPILIV
jgi:hypothetical protein